MITFVSEDVLMPVFSKRAVVAWIRSVAADYGKTLGEVVYVFCSDKRILEVNRQYLQHDYFTDIITFDYSTDTTLSGDIFISIDTVCSNASEWGVSFDEELKRILIHGILHLCGQGDKTPETRKQMTEKENKALQKLR